MYKIRKYKPSDKQALREICMETADDFFKKNDKLINAIPVIYSDYFTDCEAQNIFVAADESDRAVGYIICSSDTALFKKKMKKIYMPKAIKMHPFMFFVCFAYMTAIKMHRGNIVHLHIDITSSYQHMGVGTALIDALREYLAENGETMLYVNAIKRKASAYNFYRKYGFQETAVLAPDFVTLGIPTGK